MMKIENNILKCTTWWVLVVVHIHEIYYDNLVRDHVDSF